MITEDPNRDHNFENRPSRNYRALLKLLHLQGFGPVRHAIVRWEGHVWVRVIEDLSLSPERHGRKRDGRGLRIGEPA